MNIIFHLLHLLHHTSSHLAASYHLHHLTSLVKLFQQTVYLPECFVPLSLAIRVICVPFRISDEYRSSGVIE